MSRYGERKACAIDSLADFSRRPTFRTLSSCFFVLSEYFQHRNVSDLYLQSASWYAEQSPDRFDYRLGETVVSIDKERRSVRTSKGNTFQFVSFIRRW